MSLIQASNFVSFLSPAEHMALPPTHQDGGMSCYLVSHLHLSTPITIPTPWRGIPPPTQRLYLGPASSPPTPGPLSPLTHQGTTVLPTEAPVKTVFSTLPSKPPLFSFQSCRLPPHTSAFLSDFTPFPSLQPTWHSAIRLVFFKILLSSCHHFAQNPMFLCLI